MPKPILIAGAGPVGLTAAMELARYGMPLRVIDPAPARSGKSKALAVWQRTLELLDRAGCAGAFLAAGVKARAVTITSGEALIARVPLEADAAFPQLLIIPQSETERLLEEALDRLGVPVERNVELAGFTDGAGGVTARLRRADGTEEVVEASWLIGCDGAHSLIRHALNLKFHGDTLPTQFVLADVRVEGLNKPEDELAMFWHEDGLLAFFPFSNGRYRIIGDLGDDASGDPDLAQLQALVRHRAHGAITLSDPVWLSSFRINERMVRNYRVGHVFLAGDAAHVHSPAGGQGMNTGMQDAFNLAWKLALVEGGAAGPNLLNTYDAERRPIAADVLAQSGRLTRMAMLRDPLLQTLRNFVAHHLLGLQRVQRAMAGQLSEASVHYPRGALVAGDVRHLAGPAPGERIVAETPFGAGDRPRFALMAKPDRETQRLLADHAALLEPVLRDPPDAAGAWLVRPDGYVAAVDRAGDLHTLRGMLERIADRRASGIADQRP